MSANPSQRAPDSKRPAGRADPVRTTAVRSTSTIERASPGLASVSNARVRQMLKDLDTPLDGVPTGNDGRLEKRLADARRDRNKKTRRAYRADLRRARDAAKRVFHVKPSLSSRRTATALLTAGAIGVSAFTGPPTIRFNAPSAIESVYEDPTQTRIDAQKIGTSAQFKQALIEEEGVRQVVYRDVAGYPTVGVGHLIEPQDNLRVGDRVSTDRVLGFLDGDIAEAENHVRALVGNLPLFQHEFDALVDLVYNVGRGNVSASESPRLNAAIDAGDYELIASELNYTHAAGRVARGLEFRSERREAMFLQASYEDPREAGPSRSDA